MLRGILRVEHAAPTRGTNSPKVARRDLILGFFQFWFGVNTGLGRKLTSLCEVCRAVFWAHRIRKPLACRTIAGRRYRLVRRWHPGCCRSRSSCLLLSRTLVRFWACCCKLGVWLICLLRREPAQNHPGALNTQLRGGGSAGGSSATKRKRKEQAAQQEMLTRLCTVLGSLIGTSPTNKPKKKKKKKKRPITSETSTGSGGALVDQLSKVVEDIRKEPSTLISKLESFLSKAKGLNVDRRKSPDVAQQSDKWVDVVKKTSAANPTATKRVSSSVSLARQCWKAGEVRDFGEVRKKLENGEAPVGSVALAPSVDKALELKLLAEGHKLDTVKFACLVAGVNLSSLPAGVSVVTLPVVTSAGTGIQSTKFHKLACVLLGREAPVLPTGLVKHVASAPVAKELVTLRFVVPRAFLSNEQWQLWKTKATSMIQEWVGMDKNCAIHTSYGWSVTSQVNWKGAREEFLLGYAKVSSDKLEAVWCHSGRSGVFLDRLAKERDGSKFVSWLDHGELEALEYLNLALTKAITLKAGVAWRAGGANCLGLRSSVAPTEQSVSVWRAKAVPFAWSESDLFQVLKDAGWTELSVVAYPTKKVRPWLLKAKPPAVLTGGFAGIEVGESLVIMEKAGARGPVNRESKKLVLRPRVGASASAITPSVESSQVPTVAATQMEVSEEEEDKDNQEGKGGAKRTGSPPGSAEHVKTKQKTASGAVQPRKLVFPGFVERDCGAEGSCGFNAIAVGAALMRGSSWDDVQSKKAAMGATLRVQVGQHITKHESTYKPFWSPDVSNTTVEKEDGAIPTDWASWLQAIRRHKRWICGLTIKAAATRLGVKIIVVIKQPDGSWGLPMAFGSTKKKEIPILMGLDEGAGHYVLLVPDSESMIPRSWLSAGQCEVTMTSQNVLRGAGGSDDAGDGWLPPPPLVVKKRNGLVGSHLRLLSLFPTVPIVPRVGCLLVRLVAFRLDCVLMLAYSLFLLRLPLCKLWLRQRSKFLLRARWLLMDPRLNGLVRSA